MGNCMFGGLGDGGGGVIKVTTSSGGIMEFNAPITAGCITDEFPGHAIFPSQDLFWRPFSYHEDLLPGRSYYLFPVSSTGEATDTNLQIIREGHVRSKSIPTASLVTPYRMSFDYQGMLKRSYTEVLSRYNNNNKNKKKSRSKIGGNGFWKVKLVISPEQLLEILSQEARTEELIENVRAVAKCGNGITSSSASASSFGFSSSDQWSLSSSRNASSKKDGLLLVDI